MSTDPPGVPGSDLARIAWARARAEARRRAAAAGERPPTDRTDPSSRLPAHLSGRRRGGRGEEVRSGPGPDERDPLRLSAAVRRLLRDRGWEAEAAAGSLIGRWQEIVGADLALHVVPESFTPGTGGEPGRLVLRADSTAWATQVRLLLPVLRRRVDDALGRGVVGELAVIGPSAPRWAAGPRRVRGRGPRDTYG